MSCKLYYVCTLQELIQVFHWVFFFRKGGPLGVGVSIFMYILQYLFSASRLQDVHGQSHNCIRNMKSCASCWLKSGIPVAAEQENLFFKPGSHPQEVREVMENSHLTLGSVWRSGCTDIIISFVWVCCRLLRTSQDALLVFQSSSMKPLLCPRNSYMRHVISHVGHLTPAKWGTFKTTHAVQIDLWKITTHIISQFGGKVGFVLFSLLSRCHTCTYRYYCVAVLPCFSIPRSLIVASCLFCYVFLT